MTIYEAIEHQQLSKWLIELQELRNKHEQCQKDTIKHGHWIHGSSSENIRITCSECGYKVNYFWDSWQIAKYCPNCGARMDGDKDEIG